MDAGIAAATPPATLVPAMAQEAAHVTMLQRSPSYFLAPPLTHELAVTLRQLDIPEDWAHVILRRASQRPVRRAGAAGA